MDDYSTDKKAKGTKKCVIKKILKFNNYKDCLLNNEIILKSQQRFKSEAHNGYSEEVNKTALSSNDGKRLQTFIELHHIFIEQVMGKYVKQMLSKVNIKCLILIIILIIRQIKQNIRQNIIQIGHTFQIIHTEYSLQVVLD